MFFGPASKAIILLSWYLYLQYGQSNAQSQPQGFIPRYHSRDDNGVQERNAVASSDTGDHSLTTRDNPKPVMAINSCPFPPGMHVVQPAYLQLNKFLHLNKPNLRPGNNGAKGRIYDDVVKWYVVVSFAYHSSGQQAEYRPCLYRWRFRSDNIH